MTEVEFLNVIAVELLRARAARLDVPPHLSDDPTATVETLQSLCETALELRLYKRDGESKVVKGGDGKPVMRPLPDAATWAESMGKARAINKS